MNMDLLVYLFYYRYGILLVNLFLRDGRRSDDRTFNHTNWKARNETHVATDTDKSIAAAKRGTGCVIFGSRKTVEKYI